MKTKLALAILMLSASVAAAQYKMADQLRKAIVEEESNQNLDKAIQAYQNILAQFTEERQTAAAALFHLADCYRKQGKRNQAIAAYRRVLQEFSDQTKLADASRTYLSRNYGVNESQTGGAETATKEIAAARQRYRYLLQEQIVLAEGQIQMLQNKVEIGLVAMGGPEMTAAKMELIDLQKTLALFDAGLLPIPQSATKK